MSYFHVLISNTYKKKKLEEQFCKIVQTKMQAYRMYLQNKTDFLNHIWLI